MRILDRHETRQLLPVWLWCLVVFITVSLFIDLFEHLDEILRYGIPPATVARYYLSFAPLVFVQACPLALLLSTAFVATRLVRHQELLAMTAGGVSRLRVSVPFLFVGWLATALVFVVNDRIVPDAAATYQRLREEAFRAEAHEAMHNVATMDNANRLYHARVFDPLKPEIGDLTVLEHDAANRPRRSIYARRAIPVADGWRLFEGTITQMDSAGKLEGNPEPFIDRVLPLPITAKSFQKPEAEASAMSFHQLRSMLDRLRRIGITNVRRYEVELASKVTMPIMNLVVCLIAFLVATKPSSRGRLQELGLSLGWGVLYYLVVAGALGMGKESMVPVPVAVLGPHLLALAICWRALHRRN
jgi:lipopolysaccharide export system permease protein